MAENVKVIVRCRPMNKKEQDTNCKCVVRMRDCVIETWDPNEGPSFPKQFTFDSVYDQDAITETIYNEICYPLIESSLEGYNSTIFVYGQTGCGKSFTMEGCIGEKGIISRAFEHIFEAIAVTTGVKYLALVSYLEIYNEQLRDLLVNGKAANLGLKEVPNEGVVVPGLTQHPVHNIEECEQLLNVGSKNRMIGATLMNQVSSRSHCIFSISIEQMTTSNDNNDRIRKGKLNLVDLAGSERQTKTGATGERLKEATKINLSLSALGNVISALVDGKAKHIPYRDSKLTRLLQDSLGGNTRTLMIACISPSERDYSETLSTLRYANRAKNIHNKPRVNEDPKETMLRSYQEEISRLRNLLDNRSEEINRNITSTNTELDLKRDQLIQEYQTEMEKLKNLHENEKIEKENVLKQIEMIKAEYEKNIEALNNEMKVKFEKHLPANKEEILRRIETLKAVMIGGEKADDKELSDRRKRKKMAAERRASAIAHVLAKIDMNEDRELLQNQYRDITDELNLKTDALRRYRHRVKILLKEIADLQSEFETERQDYLETIRKQEMHVKLLSQIAAKIAGALKKECNYRDLEAIKEQAIWMEDAQKFKLPNLVVYRTKLPPPVRLSDIQTAPGRLESDSESFDDDSDNKNSLAKKLEKTEEEDIVTNYFKPKRATKLLNEFHRLDTAKVFSKWRAGVTVPEYTVRRERHHRSSENLTKSAGFTDGSLWINGRGLPTLEVRRPIKLEALPSIEKKRKSDRLFVPNAL